MVGFIHNNNKQKDSLAPRAMLLVLLSSLVFELKSEELPNSFFDLSLEQLGEIQITTAAKKPQNISLTAASVFILHPEQIKRSGVTTIPDALRLVPGMQVAKMEAINGLFLYGVLMILIVAAY